MGTRFYIGIDPGRKTGFAVWDSSDKKLCVVKTFSFWQVADELEEISSTFLIHAPEPCALDVLPTVVIEDPSKNKPTFFRKGMTQREMQKISQNVGANKEHGLLMIDRAESLGFEVIRVRPYSKTQTKLKADTFKKITGYQGRTSEHARDAAMLVFGR